MKRLALSLAFLLVGPYLKGGLTGNQSAWPWLSFSSAPRTCPLVRLVDCCEGIGPPHGSKDLGLVLALVAALVESS